MSADFNPVPVPGGRDTLPLLPAQNGAADAAAPPVKSARKPASPNARFPIGAARRDFRKAFYPDATAEQWNDWRWQVRNRIRDLPALTRLFRLSDDERQAVEQHSGPLPVGITPYYASLMSGDDPSEPLRRTHLPVMGEYVKSYGEYEDPLGEEHDSVAPGLVHRYPDRVLFLTTGFCSTYCRYCTRSRMVGGAGETTFSIRQWEQSIAYIAAHPEVRDVLLSGGDPLTIADDKLDWLLTRLRAIPHVEFIRIGTKVPMVMPMRVTKALTKMLRKHHPVWMSLHITHPDELTPEATEATARLADAGIPLGSQTVLLKGINDDAALIKTLMHGLLKRRIKPYYLFQSDPVKGTSHFRTPVEKGLEIIRALRGHTTGYAVPHFIIDAPGGGGKVQVSPDYIEGRSGDDLIVRNFEGDLYPYADPGSDFGAEKGDPLAAGKAA